MNFHWNSLALMSVLIFQLLFYQGIAVVPGEDRSLKTTNFIDETDDLNANDRPNVDRAENNEFRRYKRYTSRKPESEVVIEEKHLTLGILVTMIINTVFVFSIFFILLIMAFGKEAPRKPPFIYANEKSFYETARPGSARVPSVRSLNRRRRDSMSLRPRVPSLGRIPSVGRAPSLVGTMNIDTGEIS